ncbi:ABC transporter substrate-binding protein [Senegalia massiliensis]|nr:ABC transporter substrate-binding protein [Senegalia massiliensis]
MKKKKVLVLLLLILFLTIIVSGCSDEENDEVNSNTDTNSKEISSEVPTLKLGYIFTNHQTPIMVAASKQEKLTDNGIHLEEVIEKEKYKLMEGEEHIANVDLVVSKSGSETMTLLAQNHIDIGLASNTAFITARDQGNPVKILAPVHTEGIGLVVNKDSEINDWEEFLAKSKENEKPMSIGYHSPTSAPLILLEAALKNEDVNYTKDPSDVDADILLVDLKGTSNFIPATTSNQVDAWVGPAPYPELATVEDVGKIILDMKHLPPEGNWHDFPCCVMGTTEDLVESNPQEIEKLLELITAGAEYAQNNRDEAAKITSDFTGVSYEAAKLSTIKYTTNPSDVWIDNMDLTYQTLKNTNSLTDKLVEKSFEEASDEIFDFSFIRNTLK